MDAIKRFANFQNTVTSESTGTTTPQTSQQKPSAGVGDIADSFENFQKGSFDLSNLLNPGSSILPGDAGVKWPGELVDKDSMNAPDGDFTEMYFGWEQIPLDRQRGVNTSQEDAGISRIKERVKQAGDDKKSEDQKSADEMQSQEDADLDYTDKHLPDGPEWDSSPDGVGGGPAWMGNPEARRYVHIPGLDGRGEATGNPTPDGGGEEPSTPGPKKNHGDSGDDEKSSGASGSDAGNYPFVGEEGTIIHPQVNVASTDLKL